MPALVQESSECPGTSNGAPQRPPRGPYQSSGSRSTSARNSSEVRPHAYEPAQRPNDGEYEPALLSNQELLNQALSAVLNGASGIPSGFTSPPSCALNGLEHPDEASARHSTTKEEAMDESGLNGTTESLKADVVRPSDDLHNMTLDQLKEEVLRSEIRRNLSEERRNQSEERRNLAMARFFNSLVDRI
ncbi:hypothetical protein AAVH_37888 [Aphelenchoides avenae]|nr:hypothetical protein AAVH_37888 [Aphelenchus avenae]